MDSIIEAALARLNSQLPLKARQDSLPQAVKSLHQHILQHLASQGRPPDADEVTSVPSLQDYSAGLQRLAADDLVVLDSTGNRIMGAYPLTIESTPHRVTLHGHTLHAMCALDAVSVAPMFATEVLIESVCHASKTPVVIHMRDSRLLKVQPGAEVMIGIRWQMPSAVAAHSMCLQMVFLKDRQTADTWQDGDRDNVSLFTLPAAVAFGKAFFLPLLT